MTEPLVGLETELFVINNKGKFVNKADLLLKEVDSNRHIMKECAKSMVEIAAPPDVAIHKTSMNLLNNMENLLAVAEKKNLSLLPLGSYPGKAKPEMRTSEAYNAKMKLFGNKRFFIAGRCAGFHCHYDLPFSLPLLKNLSLLQFLDIKHESAMINGYNMMIAMDPALTTFMQSSPFYEGKNLGKDSRMIVYRGSECLKYPNSLYARYPEFGHLPSYKHSVFELLDMIQEKFNDWKNNILSVGVNIKSFSLYGSLLSTAWNPVKINPLGTLEQRGMDMNQPQNIIAATALIKYTIKRIYDDGLNVVPDAIGIEEPFKVEGDTLYIPPDKYVYKNLQYASAYHGLDNNSIQKYCRGLLTFARSSLNNKKSASYFHPFEKMLENRQTVADEIIKDAKKLGWKKDVDLTQNNAKEIAIEHANKLFKSILFAKKQMKKAEVL